MFINLSNHPSDRWSPAQRDAATTLGGGKIVDLQFPNVPPMATTEEVKRMANDIVDKIDEMIDDRSLSAVLVQGEMTLTFSIVYRLSARFDGLNVVSACTERKSIEKVQDDGATVKQSVFEFVQFREYF